jgi:hypothetical protein
MVVTLFTSVVTVVVTHTTVVLVNSSDDDIPVGAKVDVTVPVAGLLFIIVLRLTYVSSVLELVSSVGSPVNEGSGVIEPVEERVVASSIESVVTAFREELVVTKGSAHVKVVLGVCLIVSEPAKKDSTGMYSTDSDVAVVSSELMMAVGLAIARDTGSAETDIVAVIL